MFMMGIIKNCCLISYKSLDHLQSGIPTSGDILHQRLRFLVEFALFSLKLHIIFRAIHGSTSDWLFAAMRKTSCSPSPVTIFVGLSFMTIYLAVALVLASNLDCSIGFALSFNSISVS